MGFEDDSVLTLCTEECMIANAVLSINSFIFPYVL